MRIACFLYIRKEIFVIMTVSGLSWHRPSARGPVVGHHCPMPLSLFDLGHSPGSCRGERQRSSESGSFRSAAPRRRPPPQQFRSRGTMIAESLCTYTILYFRRSPAPAAAWCRSRRPRGCLPPCSGPGPLPRNAQAQLLVDQCVPLHRK